MLRNGSRKTYNHVIVTRIGDYLRLESRVDELVRHAHGVEKGSSTDHLCCAHEGKKEEGLVLVPRSSRPGWSSGWRWRRVVDLGRRAAKQGQDGGAKHGQTVRFGRRTERCPVEPHGAILSYQSLGTESHSARSRSFPFAAPHVRQPRSASDPPQRSPHLHLRLRSLSRLPPLLSNPPFCSSYFSQRYCIFLPLILLSSSSDGCHCPISSLHIHQSPHSHTYHLSI